MGWSPHPLGDQLILFFLSGKGAEHTAIAAKTGKIFYVNPQGTLTVKSMLTNHGSSMWRPQKRQYFAEPLAPLRGVGPAAPLRGKLRGTRGGVKAPLCRAAAQHYCNDWLACFSQ